MNDRSTSALARRPATWLLLALIALTPLAGCECSSTLPGVPVVLPPLSAIVVTPATDTVRVGETVRFGAVALDTLGQPVVGAGFAWSSGDPVVFSARPGGMVTALAEGRDTVFAKAGDRIGFATVFVYRDSGWITQATATPSNLNGVFFLADGRTGWVVGGGGAILHTDDGGARWTSQASHTSYNLNSVWFTQPGTGWAVGDLGTLMRTANGGDNWTRLDVGASQNLTDICFANPDTGWAVGSAGLVLRTVDGGATWQPTTLTTFALRSVSFAGTLDGWAVGDGGATFGTRDGGLIWLHDAADGSLAIKAVWRRRAEAAWAVGAEGLVSRTVGTPAAFGWDPGNIGASNQLEGVHFPDDQIGYAVGYNGGGLILRSDDGGATWKRQVAHTSHRLNDVFFVDAQRGWAVGDGGAIVHTALGGRD